MTQEDFWFVFKIVVWVVYTENVAAVLAVKVRTIFRVLLYS